MARQRQVVWTPTAASVALALASVPVAYLFNKGAKHLRPEVILVAAGLLMVATAHILRRAIPAQPKIFYGFSLFAFTSAIDLLIPLEIDGFVTNFMDVYLRNGEPYLFSAWGAISAYWDGTFNLLCYILMGYFVSNGLPYRDLAILYSSNILNSMVVLLLGAFLSHTGLHWCTILNIPYVALPAYVLWTALGEPRSQKSVSWPEKRLRAVAILLLVAASVVSCTRGISSMGSRVPVMSFYRDSVEPLFNQKIPAPFAGVQGIVCLFYFAPAYVAMAIALHNKSIRTWVKDLAIVVTGAALQAEVSLVGMEHHPLTLSEHRLSAEEGVFAHILHWAAHLLTLAAPLAVVLITSCDCAKDGGQAQPFAQTKQQDKKSSEGKKKSEENKEKSKENKEKSKENKEKNKENREKNKENREKNKESKEKNKESKENKEKNKENKEKNKENKEKNKENKEKNKESKEKNKEKGKENKEKSQENKEKGKEDREKSKEDKGKSKENNEKKSSKKEA